jgi:hypothetical protein
MKDIDRKDPPDVSGGYRPAPGGEGCTEPIAPYPIDYPRFPIPTCPEPWVDPVA